MKKMQKGFTLIEMIFVIIIMGILGAVAIPRFKYLKQNSEIANVLAAIYDLNGSGGSSSYLNSTELREIPDSELNITNLYKFNGKNWVIYNDNDDANYTSKDGKLKLHLSYDDNGTINGEIDCQDPYGSLLAKKGITCSNGSPYTFTIKLAEE